MPTSRPLLKSARLFHLYSGVFFTPALLFFAFTGAVQSMNWHETTRGSSYKPPAILVKLGQLHKKETLVLPERKPAPPAIKQEDPVPAAKPTFDPTHLGDHTNQQKHDSLDRAEGPRTGPVAPSASAQTASPAIPQQKAPNTFPLKVFSFLAGAGLFLSTLTGLYMSYQYSRNRVPLTFTLVAGLLVPLVLLALQ